jgi:phosphatidylinositol glycan class O
LQKLAANEKTSARIFKALADPPTTSLQRLKVTVAFKSYHEIELLLRMLLSHMQILQCDVIQNVLHGFNRILAKCYTQALTTGGLPTFIDVGNSFGAPAIVEDNIMHQVHLTPRSILVMTWSYLSIAHAGLVAMMVLCCLFLRDQSVG